MNYPGLTRPELSSCSGALTLELDPQNPDFSDIPPTPLDRETAATLVYSTDGRCLESATA